MNHKLAAGLLAGCVLINTGSIWAMETENKLDLSVTESSIETSESDLTIEVEEQIEVESEESLVTKFISIYLNKPEIIIDGTLYTAPYKPQVIHDTTYLPIKILGEYILGKPAFWESQTKSVTLNFRESSIVMKADDLNVLIDGEEKTLLHAPVLIEGRIWIPLKEVAKLLEMPITFLSSEKRVDIEVTVGEEEGYKNEPPIAHFEFNQERYIQGQPISIKELSLDPEGRPLKKWEWQVNGKNVLKEDVEKALKVGENKVSLRVQDDLGAWSEWHTQSITLLPNEKPVVTKLKSDQSRYKRGEEIHFEFEYDNEDWENIVEEKWTYRKEGEAHERAIEEKPEKLFYEGTYIIGLELKDAFGNWSERKEIEVKVGHDIIQTEMEYVFGEAPLGTILQNYNHFNYNNYIPIRDNEIINTGHTLIMSNSPESIYAPGILYEDTVQGEIRVLYHHKNNMPHAKATERLVIVAENTTDEPIIVVTNRKSHKGPDVDVLHMGQRVVYDFLNNEMYEKKTLQPGEKMYLFDSQGKRWRKGDTLSGVMDLYCQSPLKITVAAAEKETQLKEISQLTYLQKDGIHTRGTFPNADRYYTFELDHNEAQKLVLGLDGIELETALEGYDALTKETVLNKGNYGMLYHLRVTAKKDTGVLLNPRGGVFKGAVAWKGEGSIYAPKSHLKDNIHAAYVGTLEKGESYEMLYMLPNGSSAPILIGFVPENLWRTHP